MQLFKNFLALFIKPEKALISQCQRSHHTESWCKSTERVCDVCWFNAPCKEEDIKGRVPETSFQGLHHLWKTSPGHAATQQWTPQSHVSNRPTCSWTFSLFDKIEEATKSCCVTLTTDDQHNYEKETSNYQVDNKLPATTDSNGKVVRLDHYWSEVDKMGSYPCVLQSYP